MKFISPIPRIWHDIHQRLEWYWINKLYRKVSPPPTPMILGGWNFSSDYDKKRRWNETLEWANEHDCLDLISVLKEDEQYCVNEFSDWVPYQFSNWDEEPRNRPSDLYAEQCLKKLKKNWSDILDRNFGRYSTPLEFSGKKLRRLLVIYENGYMPPWGSWTDHLANGLPSKFTELRKKVNSIIAPHEVDHIDFKEIIKEESNGDKT